MLRYRKKSNESCGGAEEPYTPTYTFYPVLSLLKRPSGDELQAPPQAFPVKAGQSSPPAPATLVQVNIYKYLTQEKKKTSAR